MRAAYTQVCNNDACTHTRTREPRTQAIEARVRVGLGAVVDVEGVVVRQRREARSPHL